MADINSRARTLFDRDRLISETLLLSHGFRRMLRCNWEVWATDCLGVEGGI